MTINYNTQILHYNNKKKYLPVSNESAWSIAHCSYTVGMRQQILYGCLVLLILPTSQHLE